MNSITIALYCLIFLVVQQGIDAINCYACTMGTDGCGPSFNTKGSGVITTTSNTSAVYCSKSVVTSNTNAISRSFGLGGTFVQQGIDAIDCYSCNVGTDGCGPSFDASGSGVTHTSDSSAAYCSVRMSLSFL
ncbi:unnamed protein product [Rotaria sp. Silwood1]|nr:unnamed protein product [Rotaria sp. Silwood1]